MPLGPVSRLALFLLKGCASCEASEGYFRLLIGDFELMAYAKIPTKAPLMIAPVPRNINFQ
jgi:hypothetical protein